MNAETIGSRIRFLRNHLGLSQNEFSKQIKRTPGFISQAEHDIANISEDTLLSICNIYHVRREWLQHGEGEMFEAGYEGGAFDYTALPERIRLIRKELCLTQELFARGVGCSKSQIVSIEIGRARPSRELLHKICSFSGASFPWLTQGVGEMFSPSEDTEHTLDRINDYLRSDSTARALVLEAIAQYETSHDPAVWDRIDTAIHSDEM